jgi:VCBS repeat-containing protein
MASTSSAIVNEISGRAWLRNSDGSLTELHQGSKVPAGSDIVTASGATVSLQVGNGVPIVIGEGREVALTSDVTGPLADPSEAAMALPSGTDSDRLLAALSDGRDPFDELDPTAAVTAGGGDAGGSSFVRLARILEATNPLEQSYSPLNRGDDILPRVHSAAAAGLDDETSTPPVVGGNGVPSSTAISGTSGIDAQTGVRYDVSTHFSDPDASDKLTYTATGLPPGLSIDPDTGVISGNINHAASQGGNNGVYTVTVSATDPPGATTSQTFTWDVANPAPAAVDDAGATDEKTSLNVDARNGVLANDSDPDGDTLTVTQVNGNPAYVGTAIAGSNGGLFTLNADGSYTFEPGSAFQHLAAGDKAHSSVTYTVSDGEGGTSTATLTIEITGTNQAPVILPHINQVLEDHSASGNVLGGATDADNDVLSVATYTVDGAKYVAGNTAYIAGVGSILINANGSYTFTPDADWNGAVPQISYTVTDGSVTTSSTLDIGVLSVNDAPLSRDGSATAVAGERYVFSLDDFPFSDPAEGHSMKSVIIDSLPLFGTLLLNGEAITPGREISLADLANGKLTFQPDADNFRYSDGSTFEFRVKDTGGTANGGQDTSHQQTFKLSTGELVVGSNDHGDRDSTLHLLRGLDGNDVMLGDQGGVLGIPPLPPNTAGGWVYPDHSEREIQAKSGLGHVLAPLDRDEILGNGGSDILFGDAINTDFLPWGVDGNPARPEGLLDGSGLWALKEFLLLKNGVPPTDADLHRFISDNHDMLDVQGDTRGGADYLYGGEGDDILYGQGGNDWLLGGPGQDILSGGTGDDILRGNGGNDVLIGGMGDDIMSGDGYDFYDRGSPYSEGSDTFKWTFNDQGTITAPAVDTVKDFSILKPVEGGDILDLQGLLVGENDGNLTKYLDFRKEGNNTVIDVNTQGKLSIQGADQKIVLENVDLTHDANGQFMSNQAIINDLLQKGKLVVDHG